MSIPFRFLYYKYTESSTVCRPYIYPYLHWFGLGRSRVGHVSPSLHRDIVPPPKHPFIHPLVGHSLGRIRDQPTATVRERVVCHCLSSVLDSAQCGSNPVPPKNRLPRPCPDPPRRNRSVRHPRRRRGRPNPTIHTHTYNPHAVVTRVDSRHGECGTHGNTVVPSSRLAPVAT